MATVGAFAVPIFFMVSCYFSHNATRKKLVHSIVHTIQLIAIAYAINLLRIFISESCSISGMIDYLRNNILTIKHLVMWLVLNTTLISGVAWFLWALLYCYLFSLCFYYFFSSSKVYIVLLLGIMGGMISQIGLPLVGMDRMGTNNVWFCGLPFFYWENYFMKNRMS